VPGPSRERLPSVAGSTGSGRDLPREQIGSHAGPPGGRAGSSVDSALRRRSSVSFVAVDEVDNEEQDPNGKNFGQFAKAFARAGSFVKLSSEEAQIGEIKKRVDVARKAGKLDLSGLGIKALPQIAIDLGQAARVVWMHDNQLETLSAAHLTAWKSLAQLKLSSNLLTELPPEVGKCRNLAMLLVDHNRLVAIPSTIAQCKSLTYLSIAHNRISRLPVAVAECARLNEFEFTGNPFAFPHRKILKEGKAGVLKYLKRFTAACKSGVLDLTQADLTELPQEVGYVGAKLRHLKMNDINPPSGFRFPFEIAKCTNLERLELHPQLKILSPPEETAAKGIKVILLYLTRFDRAKETMKLDLSHMNLAGFPLEISAESGMDLGEVRHLVLDDNNITAIPQALSLLPGLTRLDASRNELKTLPAALARLPLLEAMVVEQNRLLEVSEALGKIPLLTSLSLRANRIAQIAPGLVNMSALRHLDLGENALRALSVHLGNWQARPLQLPPPPPARAAARHVLRPHAVHTRCTAVAHARGPRALSGAGERSARRQRPCGDPARDVQAAEPHPPRPLQQRSPPPPESDWPAHGAREVASLPHLTPSCSTRRAVLAAPHPAVSAARCLLRPLSCLPTAPAPRTLTLRVAQAGSAPHYHRGASQWGRRAPAPPHARPHGLRAVARAAIRALRHRRVPGAAALRHPGADGAAHRRRVHAVTAADRGRRGYSGHLRFPQPEPRGVRDRLFRVCRQVAGGAASVSLHV
jgi:Leucine-rich repeat (LRR) protein